MLSEGHHRSIRTLVVRSRATKWSFHQERRNIGRTSRRSVNCSPCFISVSLGILFEAKTLPRRFLYSRWALEHGTTRHCRNSIPRRPSHLLPHRQMHSRRRIRRGSTSRQRIWPPPGDGAAQGYSLLNPPAGDAAEAWVHGVICRDRRSNSTRGRSLIFEAWSEPFEKFSETM